MHPIQRYRRARGLTAKALAEILDVTPTTVSFWEQGRRSPKDELIPSLAETLKVDAQKLVDEIHAFNTTSKVA